MAVQPPYPPLEIDPKVVQLFKRLASPHWMQNPRSWVWQREDGGPQGFGPICKEHPGLANLLWLSMDMVRPPLYYDGVNNALYNAVLVLGHSALLDGEPLFDRAALDPLHQFYNRLPDAEAPGARGLETMYPLLKLLAARRLTHANP